MLDFLRRRSRTVPEAPPAPSSRLTEDLDRILAAMDPAHEGDRSQRVEALTTAVAALNALMCKGADHRYSGIDYAELRGVVGDYLERSAFPVLVGRLGDLPITLSLVTAAAKDCQMTQTGQDDALLAEIRNRAAAIISQLNRCVLA